MLAHPYQGIFHDANLYTLQALARLHPDALSQDVFLRFGSQDRFTIFSPIYAFAIRLLGVDHAAALLTLISQACLVAAGWRLARTVMPPVEALLGVAVLISVPCNYGPERIFACIEPFLTPRTAAEACAAMAVAMAFSGRRLLGGTFLIIAVALHPVMAAAAVVMVFMALVAWPRPRMAALVSLVALAWLLTAAYVVPAGQWGRLNADWVGLVQQRSPQLFIANWPIDDWGRACVALSTLLIGAFSLDLPARRLCLAAALTMIAGIALTGLAGDFLRLTLILQMQPWRWQWIATLVSAVILPLIVMQNWGRGTAERSTVLLLCAAQIFGIGAFAMITCLVALLSLSFGRLKPREAKLVLWGSGMVLTLALIWRVASNLEFAEMHFMNASLPLWFRRSVSFSHDGLVTVLSISIAVWIGTRRRAVVGAWVCTTLASAAIAALWTVTWDAWSREEFPQKQLARFAMWREVIPPDAEVFWGESPLSSWILLNRANYLSSEQTSGLVFTRASALEFQRRALALSSIIPPAMFLSWDNAGEHLSLSPQALEGICGLNAFDYLVTTVNLDMRPIAMIDRLKLYACTPQARAAAAAT